MLFTLSRRLNIFVLLIALILINSVQAQDETPLISAQSCAAAGSLDLWVWDANWGEILERSVAAWEAAYCNGAQVNIVVHPWEEYWNLVKTAATEEDLPDVLNMSQDRFYFYADNETLLDLQPYWDQYGVDTTLWGTGLVDPYRWGEFGDLYAGPVNWDTVAIYYNKDMFDAVELDYPTSDWTWDEFAADAAALTSAENDIYGAAVYSEYQAGYANWIAASGLAPIVREGRTDCTLQEPGSLEALNFLKALYDAGHMPSMSEIGGSSADDAFAFWAAGRVAMIIGGSWKLPQAFAQVEFNWDVVRLPRNPETGRSRSILHSVGYVAGANTDNPELAANLILFLSSDEGQRFFAEAGGVAPANPAPSLQQIWIDSFGDTDVNIQTFVDATRDSQGVTVFDEIWESINTDLPVNIFGAAMSVDEATQIACDFIHTQLPSANQ